MMELLRAGKVNVIVRSVPLAVLSQRDDPDIQIGMFVGAGSHFAFGVRKGDTVLREALNEHIDLLRQTGQWNRLVVKYFGPSAVGDPEEGPVAVARSDAQYGVRNSSRGKRSWLRASSRPPVRDSGLILRRRFRGHFKPYNNPSRRLFFLKIIFFFFFFFFLVAVTYCWTTGQRRPLLPCHLGVRSQTADPAGLARTGPNGALDLRTNADRIRGD